MPAQKACRSKLISIEQIVSKVCSDEKSSSTRRWDVEIDLKGHTVVPAFV